MKISTFLASAFLTLNLSAQNFDKVVINPTQITENIYMLEGSGGNIGVFTGPEGTLVIDDQFAPLSDKIKAVIDSLSDNPIKYLINTHWHGDHTGGNANFAEMGATIVAHENVRKKLMTEQVRPFRGTTPAAPELAWPKLTFNDKMYVHFNGEDINLIHTHAAHTDGDALIYFPNHNVLHMGDCFFKDRFPFIDIDLGGNPKGMITVVEAALMICDDETKIIPGHGKLAVKSDLQKYYAMLKEMDRRIEEVIASGVTSDKLDIEKLTKGYETWGTGFIDPEKMVTTLYSAYTK